MSEKTKEETSGLEQVRALSHPLRLRLFELFAARPRTTKQAAEELGEPPTKLYHHVAALERAGLVRLCETRKKRGTTEKYFEAATHRVVNDDKDLPLGDPAVQRDLAAMGLLVFDQARNELVRALAALTDDSEPELMAVRGVFRMSPREAKKLSKELTDLLARIRSKRKKEGASRARAKHQRYALTIALVPTEEGE